MAEAKKTGFPVANLLKGCKTKKYSEIYLVY